MTVRILAAIASLALLALGASPVVAGGPRPTVLAPNPFAMTPPPAPLEPRPAPSAPARPPHGHPGRPPVASYLPAFSYPCCVGYWAYQWVPTAYTTYVWVPGYITTEGTLIGGGYQPRVVTGGYYQRVWVSGY
ncbi:MAG TPA: hypothetical protein VLK35_15725 [Methylomirabilota bacterium]|nr:hypothetical protein [Methylomirabilota bacterium]